MLDSLCYTGCLLDRACELRRDTAAMAARYREPRSVIIPVWQDRSFIVEGDPPQAALVRASHSAAIIESADQLVLLGTDGEGDAWFAADLSSKKREAIAQMIGHAILLPLRRVGAIMPPDHAAVLAYAQGIVHWHRRHRFCGVCGGATESREGGHVRVCVRPTCGAQHFPRTDPAVIMLVSRHDHEACLLARQARWPRGMYSTLAGFVEPGESLEEAVTREVREETGVVVTNVRYRGSQPWPFPSSIMLGFHADAETDAPIRPQRASACRMVHESRHRPVRRTRSASALARLDCSPPARRMAKPHWITPISGTTGCGGHEGIRPYPDITSQQCTGTPILSEIAVFIQGRKKGCGKR